MPPRFAFWTILIDGKPTAFRAREKDELLPTFNQLKRTNTDVVFKWFAQGRLWDSPESAMMARHVPKPPPEKRTPAWRPGGAHVDPRDRFRKKKDQRPHRPHEFERGPAGEGRPAGARKFGDRPFTPRAPKPFGAKSFGPRPFGPKKFGPKKFGPKKFGTGKPPGGGRRRS